MNSPDDEELEMKGRIETIQTTALLRSARILRRVLEICCRSDSSERPPANAGVKNNKNKILKESVKRDKYLDLARELKKLWNMKVTVIPLVCGPSCTVTKKLVEELEDLEIRGRVETIQTTAFLKSARMLRRVLKT